MSSTPDLTGLGHATGDSPAPTKAHQGGEGAEGGDPGQARNSGATGRQPGQRWPLAVGFGASLLLVGFIAYAVTRSQATPKFAASKLTVVANGKLATAFRLPRLGSGPPVALASLRGKPTVVNFFASWCPDCRQELGAFGAVSTLDKNTVNFVGVDVNDTNGTLARRLLTTAGITYPVGVDASGTIARDFEITNLPVTYFLNARGRVLGETFGAQSRSSLAGAVRLLVTLSHRSG